MPANANARALENRNVCLEMGGVERKMGARCECADFRLSTSFLAHRFCGRDPCPIIFIGFSCGGYSFKCIVLFHGRILL